MTLCEAEIMSDSALCLRIKPGMIVRESSYPDWIYRVISVDQPHGLCTLMPLRDGHGRVPDCEAEPCEMDLGVINGSFEEVDHDIR